MEKSRREKEAEIKTHWDILQQDAFYGDTQAIHEIMRRIEKIEKDIKQIQKIKK